MCVTYEYDCACDYVCTCVITCARCCACKRTCSSRVSLLSRHGTKAAPDDASTLSMPSLLQFATAMKNTASSPPARRENDGNTHQKVTCKQVQL